MSDEFIPDGQFIPDANTQASARNPAQTGPEFIPDHEFVPDEQKYGTPGQQALTVLEGGAKGFAGPVATGAEALLSSAGVPGLSPGEQAGRESANPWEHGLSEVGGLGLGMLTGTGEAKVMTAAGEAAFKAAAARGLSNKIGAAALKGAVEMATFQAGDEVSKRINDPTLGTSDALLHIGLSGALGAVGGGVFGAISPFWTKANAEPVAQGITEFNNSMEGSVIDQVAHAPMRQIEDAGLASGLRKQKPNASNIIDIAARNDLPVAEGMTSASKDIQKAEDALINGPSTLASLQRKKLYQDAYDKASNLVDRSVSANATEMSETQVGNALKQSLTNKLEAENEPIKQLYQAIEPYQQAIPLTDRSTGALSRNMTKLIEEKGLVQGSERYNFVKTFADGIDSVDNLQKLKNFRTEVNRSAGPLTKDLAGAINDKLNGVEERAIGRFSGTMKSPEAKAKIQELIGQLGEAKAQYSAFKGKLQTLGKSMGKKNVYGPQDFINFVDEMNPQTLASRLFNENNTEFTTYFAKEFPDEMSIMRGYQRGLIRSNATKEGAFLPTKAIKEITGLEPEMQKLLFTPEEMKTVGDMKTYIESFPKNFNPSGTAHETAFRAFFEHPTGAAIANLRDYGMLAFIRAFGRAVPGAEGEAGKLLPLLGKSVGSKEVNPGAFKHAVDYAMSSIRGDTSLSRAAKSAFNAAIPVSASLYPETHHIEKLNKRLQEVQKDPSMHASVGGDLGHYLPNHDIAMKGLVYNAVQYLNGLRPKTVKASPLDPDIKPSERQNQEFNRALAIAEKPLSVVSLLKDGVLTAQDVSHLRTMYPGVHTQLSQKLTDEMTKHLSKGNTVPYKMRFGLSTLFGQPLDSSLIPNNIAANQATFGQANQKKQAQEQGKTSMAGMREMKGAGRLSLSHSDETG